MITKLQISNFRCFKSLDLEGLRRLNMIIGLNASGKTALLEALAYTATAAETGNGDDWERARLLRQLRRRPQPPPEGSGNEVYSDPDRLSWDGAAETEMKVEIQGERRADRRTGPTHAVTDPDEHSRVRTGTRLWHLRATEAYGTIVARVRSVHPSVTDIGVEKHDGAAAPHVMLESDSARRPLSLASRGIEQTLNVHVAIEASRGGIALIDDIENGLDADAMMQSGQALLRAARRHDTQIFATTNNHDYVRNMGAMLADYSEDIRLIRTTIKHVGGERRHTGCIFAGDAAEAALDDNLKLR